MDVVMIGEFERRIAEMPADQVRVTLDAMALGVDDATSEASIVWFTERVISCQQELGRRGVTDLVPVIPATARLGRPPGRKASRKLTLDQAEEVRHRRAEGTTVWELSKDYGVSTATIQRIVTYVTYREESA